jgi:hypothetical protein
VRQALSLVRVATVVLSPRDCLNSISAPAADPDSSASCAVGGASSPAASPPQPESTSGTGAVDTGSSTGGGTRVSSFKVTVCECVIGPLSSITRYIVCPRIHRYREGRGTRLACFSSYTMFVHMVWLTEYTLHSAPRLMNTVSNTICFDTFALVLHSTVLPSTERLEQVMRCVPCGRGGSPVRTAAWSFLSLHSAHDEIRSAIDAMGVHLLGLTQGGAWQAGALASITTKQHLRFHFIAPALAERHNTVEVLPVGGGCSTVLGPGHLLPRPTDVTARSFRSEFVSHSRSGHHERCVIGHQTESHRTSATRFIMCMSGATPAAGGKVHSSSVNLSCEFVHEQWLCVHSMYAPPAVGAAAQRSRWSLLASSHAITALAAPPFPAALVACPLRHSCLSWCACVCLCCPCHVARSLFAGPILSHARWCSRCCLPSFGADVPQCRVSLSGCLATFSLTVAAPGCVLVVLPWLPLSASIQRTKCGFFLIL